MNLDQHSAWFAQALQEVEAALDAKLLAFDTPATRLKEAMHYAVMGGGKRIRPLLVLASAELSGRSFRDIPGLIDCAIAVEVFHTYSLVHDDLPAMDNDDLRRGRPTVHKVFDEATGLLVGDALQTMAFQSIAQSALGADQKVAIVQSLSAAGGLEGMAGGQAIDLQHVGVFLNQEDLSVMHRMKTGALLRSCAQIGGLAASLSHDEMARLDAYARALGLLFQVVDDMLDATGSSHTLGKTAGKDAKNNKPTFVSLMGLDEARRFAGQLHLEALDSLTQWGDHAGLLRSLADTVLHRTH